MGKKLASPSRKRTLVLLDETWGALSNPVDFPSPASGHVRAAIEQYVQRHFAVHSWDGSSHELALPKPLDVTASDRIALQSFAEEHSMSICEVVEGLIRRFAEEEYGERIRKTNPKLQAAADDPRDVPKSAADVRTSEVIEHTASPAPLTPTGTIAQAPTSPNDGTTVEEREALTERIRAWRLRVEANTEADDTENEFYEASDRDPTPEIEVEGSNAVHRKPTGPMTG